MPVDWTMAACEDFFVDLQGGGGRRAALLEEGHEAPHLVRRVLAERLAARHEEAVDGKAAEPVAQLQRVQPRCEVGAVGPCHALPGVPRQTARGIPAGVEGVPQASEARPSSPKVIGAAKASSQRQRVQELASLR